MKKILMIFIMCMFFLNTYAQHWKPNNPEGLIYSDSDITVIITPKNLIVHGTLVVDVVLYDSIGHPVREWEKLALQTRDEEIAYRIIYDYVTKKNGWVRIGNKDIPTLKKEEND